MLPTLSTQLRAAMANSTATRRPSIAYSEFPSRIELRRRQSCLRRSTPCQPASRVVSEHSDRLCFGDQRKLTQNKTKRRPHPEKRLTARRKSARLLHPAVLVFSSFCSSRAWLTAIGWIVRIEHPAFTDCNFHNALIATGPRTPSQRGQSYGH
jgi:hypothetical protein